MTAVKRFLNYATVSPMNEAAYEAVKQFHEDFYTTGPPEVLYRYDPLDAELAKEAALLLNCLPGEITTIKNTTEGVNIAAEALPLGPGDEILVLGNEYPANLLPWLKKQRDGLTVTVIPGTDSPRAFAALRGAIGPRTKAVTISSAQYYDGYMADLAGLSAICRARGIFLVVDAVQTIGIRAFDLQEVPVDFLVCGGQKFLGAGLGIGFMYVRQGLLPQLKDVRVGIRSMQSFAENSYVLKDTADRFQDGTQNLPGIVALHASLRRINQIGIAKIEKQNLRLLKDAKACLRRYDIPFINHADQQSNIIAMRLPDPVGLSEFLKARSVYIKPIKDVSRISFNLESSVEDVEAFAKLTRQWLDQSTHTV